MTSTSTNPPEIYKALLDVMQDVEGVAKRERNSAQNFQFRGIDAVVNALGPAFRRHGVIPVPNVLSVDYTPVSTSNNKPATRCAVTVEYVFYASDGSSVHTTVAAEAWDHGDKGTAKAMSVAFRIALLQVFALPTDEPDPDSQVYEQAAVEKVTPAQMQQIGGLLKEAGLIGDEVETQRYALFREATGRASNGGDLTKEEGDKVIQALRAKKLVEEQLGGKDITETTEPPAGAEDKAEEPPA